MVLEVKQYVIEKTEQNDESFNKRHAKKIRTQILL